MFPLPLSKKKAGCIAAVIAVIAIPALHAQTLRFEAATIKPLGPPPHTTGFKIQPGGRVIDHDTNLKGLIAAAFDVGYWQLQGAEPWMEKEEYEIEAQPSAEWRARITDLRHTWFTIDDEHLREMLQWLLVDRFQLRVHRETEIGKVYVLKQKNEKSGKLNLQPTEAATSQNPPKDDAGFASLGFGGGRWVLFNTSMPQLARFASDFYLHAPVLDQTGLSGAFDYNLHMRPEPDAVTDSSIAGLLSGIGLKLETTTGPVAKLVIDHAERPSPN